MKRLLDPGGNQDSKRPRTFREYDRFLNISKQHLGPFPGFLLTGICATSGKDTENVKQLLEKLGYEQLDKSIANFTDNEYRIKCLKLREILQECHERLNNGTSTDDDTRLWDAMDKVYATYETQATNSRDGMGAAQIADSNSTADAIDNRDWRFGIDSRSTEKPADVNASPVINSPEIRSASPVSIASSASDASSVARENFVFTRRNPTPKTGQAGSFAKRDSVKSGRLSNSFQIQSSETNLNLVKKRSDSLDLSSSQNGTDPEFNFRFSWLYVMKSTIMAIAGWFWGSMEIVSYICIFLKTSLCGIMDVVVVVVRHELFKMIGLGLIEALLIAARTLTVVIMAAWGLYSSLVHDDKAKFDTNVKWAREIGDTYMRIHPHKPTQGKSP